MRIAPLVILVSVSGCAMTDAEIRAQYSKEWQCPANQISIYRRPHLKSYTVEGCGMQAGYSEVTTYRSDPTGNYQITEGSSATYTSPREPRDQEAIKTALPKDAPKLCLNGKLGNVVVSKGAPCTLPNLCYSVSNLCAEYPPRVEGTTNMVLNYHPSGVQYRCPEAGRCYLHFDGLDLPNGRICDLNGPGTFPCGGAQKCVDHYCRNKY